MLSHLRFNVKIRPPHFQNTTYAPGVLIESWNSNTEDTC